MLEELQGRLEELEKRVEVGFRVVSDGGPGLEVREWEPGNPELVRQRDGLRERVSVGGDTCAGCTAARRGPHDGFCGGEE